MNMGIDMDIDMDDKIIENLISIVEDVDIHYMVIKMTEISKNIDLNRIMISILFFMQEALINAINSDKNENVKDQLKNIKNIKKAFLKDAINIFNDSIEKLNNEIEGL